MSDRPFEVFAHERAFGEHAGQQESEEHGEPAADRKAGLEMERMRRRRNRLGDRADDEAEELQREQRPGDRLQTGRVRGEDRKSTRLNSSHGYISYAVFCLKKKKKKTLNRGPQGS